MARELAIVQRQQAAFPCGPCTDRSSSAHQTRRWLGSLKFPERVLGQNFAARVRMLRWSLIALVQSVLEQIRLSSRVELRHKLPNRGLTARLARVSMALNPHQASLELSNLVERRSECSRHPAFLPDESFGPVSSRKFQAQPH